MRPPDKRRRAVKLLARREAMEAVGEWDPWDGIDCWVDDEVVAGPDFVLVAEC